MQIYERPVPLDRNIHQEIRIDSDRNFFFASACQTAILAAIELNQAIKDFPVQIGLDLRNIGTLKRLKVCHGPLQLYTDLNSDHAARFTSASLRVNSCASPEKQRAISEFR